MYQLNILAFANFSKLKSSVSYTVLPLFFRTPISTRGLNRILDNYFYLTENIEIL